MSLSVGTPVLVIGNPCNIRTCVGMYGYIQIIWTPEENQKPLPSYWVNLLRYPELDGWDSMCHKAREARGEFDSTLATADTVDLRILTGVKRLQRVRRFMKAERRSECRNDEIVVLWDDGKQGSYLDHGVRAEINGLTLLNLPKRRRTDIPPHRGSPTFKLVRALAPIPEELKWYPHLPPIDSMVWAVWRNGKMGYAEYRGGWSYKAAHEYINDMPIAWHME
jgi:hypothetical protein